jgi:murein DD-endopeptidase MepM/ murein hydrolase activator NlpD
VTLTAASGRVYRYLHIDMAEAHANLHVGQKLNAGDPFGHVSHDFGSTPTTIHLHFEIIEPSDATSGPGYNFVSPYTSLVGAYQRALAAAGRTG